MLVVVGFFAVLVLPAQLWAADEPSQPTGPNIVVARGDGTLYVSGYAGKFLQKFDSNGALLDSKSGPFEHIRSLTFDNQNNLYLADNIQVIKYDSQDKTLGALRDKNIDKGRQFNNLVSLAVDEQGNLYGGYLNNEGLKKMDNTGRFLTKWGESPSPVGMALDRQGNLYVVDSETSLLYKFNLDGTLLATLGSKGDKPGQLNNPLGLTVDRQGNLYIADAANNRIQKLDSNGKPLAEWRKAGSTELKRPSGVATDEKGNIYIADYGNARMVKLDANGNFLTEWQSADWKPYEGRSLDDVVLVIFGALLILIIVCVIVFRISRSKASSITPSQPKKDLQVP